MPVTMQRCRKGDTTRMGAADTTVMAQRIVTGVDFLIVGAGNGGYAFNTQMMEALDSLAAAVTTPNVAWCTDTGDGIKAAMGIGGALQAESAPMLFARGIVAPGVVAGYVTLPSGDKVFPSGDGQFNLGTQPFLKVNRNGERFTGESGTYDHMVFSACNQPGHVYASIFEANMPEDVKRFHTLAALPAPARTPKAS